MFKQVKAKDTLNSQSKSKSKLLMQQQDILRLDRIRLKLQQLKLDTERASSKYKFINVYKGNKQKRTLVSTKHTNPSPANKKQTPSKFKPVN